jgi:hypothetical protein
VPQIRRSVHESHTVPDEHLVACGSAGKLIAE